MAVQRLNIVNSSAQVIDPATVQKQDTIVAAVAEDNALNSFGESTSVPFNVETTIVSYVVPANKRLNIKGFIATGTATGKFRLKVAGVTESIIRSSASSRVASASFGGGSISATTGQTVVITALHEETSNQSMSANLYGDLTTV